jgi:hypothetical protein
VWWGLKSSAGRRLRSINILSLHSLAFGVILRNPDVDPHFHHLGWPRSALKARGHDWFIGGWAISSVFQHPAKGLALQTVHCGRARGHAHVAWRQTLFHAAATAKQAIEKKSDQATCARAGSVANCPLFGLSHRVRILVLLAIRGALAGSVKVWVARSQTDVL